MNYRSYSYINFKDFENYGFSLNLDKTIDLARLTSFEKTGDFKQNARNPLQLRIGSEGQIVNIVGFLIPTNKRHPKCLKVREIQNIKNLDDKNKNGFNLSIKFLQKSSIEGLPHNSSVYWLFDLDTDNIKLDTYEQGTKMTIQEQVKLIVNKFYDEIINEIYYKVLKNLDKTEELEIQKSLSILHNIERRTLKIPRNSDVFNDLLNYIFFEKSVKIEPKYDEKEDIFYGLTGDIIKLEYAPEPKPPKIQTIRIDTIKLKKTTVEERVIEDLEGVCQHNITWEYISVLRKKNPGKYTDLLYEFIQQYVIENNDQDYVCKSCGTLLNIKKYIIDGEYDGDTQKFITYSMPMEVPLEDIAEYEKYRNSIRNIDKLVERIAVIANIPYFIGTTLSIKWRRKAIIKDAIDIILLNNRLLKKNLKERNELSTRLYGISRDLSNLFVFELDNEIFKFSSKEKDHYKPIKQNNILSYLIILLLLEINESQLSFMTGDRKGICNFPVFDKYGNILFDGLKIRKNREGDLDNIKNYRILCYVLYLISCMVTKYNMWFFDTGEEKKKKFNPIVQKSIIHTTIDLLNSIIENSAIKGVNHIYEVITTRFYKKLGTFFNNDELISRFKSDLDKTSVVSDKKSYLLSKFEPIRLTGKYTPHIFFKSNYIFCRLPRYYIPKRMVKYSQYYHINNITNCPEGTFHSWKTKGNNFVCEICNTNLDRLKLDEKLSSEIYNNFKYLRLQKLAQKYCQHGTLHNYVISDESNISICNKCNKDENYKCSKKDLDELEKNLIKNKNIFNNIENKEIDKSESIETKEKIYQKEVYENLVANYKKNSSNDNMYIYLDSLIDEIQSSIGTETGFGTDVYLRDNVYIIDHDYLGYPYTKPIVITDKDNLIKYKQNHPFYKTDVLYYTSSRTGRIDVFYDATTLILLGYKEASKDFVLSIKPDKKLKINYSLYNKLKIMGYESRFINIEDKLKDVIDKYVGNQVENEFVLSFEDCFKELLKELIRFRISNLKKFIYEFQRFLYRIKNGYATDIKKKEKSEDNNEEEDEEHNIIEVITNKYSKRLNNMNISDQNGKHRIFKHWKAVTSTLHTENIDDMNINIDPETKLIDSEIINDYDYNGDLLLYYIISEMNKLLKYNSNKVLRTNIINFYIDFINTMFDMFNIESRINNHDIKRFIMSLKSSLYIQDIENLITGETVGIYQEYKDIDDKDNEEDLEAEDDAREEQDALDMDDELEYGDQEGEGGGFDYQSQYDFTYADAETRVQNTFWEPVLANPYGL